MSTETRKIELKPNPAKTAYTCRCFISRKRVVLIAQRQPNL